MEKPGGQEGGVPGPHVSVHHMIAFLDGEEDPLDSPNIIHSTDAKKYGFSGPLVGGVTSYSWGCALIVQDLGKKWLARGYADIQWLYPIYPDDRLTIILSDAQPNEDTSRVARKQKSTIAEKKKAKTKEIASSTPTQPKLTNGYLSIVNPKGKICVAGEVGVGTNQQGWVSECELSLRSITGKGIDKLMEAAVKKGIQMGHRNCPRLVLDDELIGKELTPMTLYIHPKRLEQYAVTIATDDSPLWKRREKRKRDKNKNNKKRNNNNNSRSYGSGIEEEYQYKLEYTDATKKKILKDGYWSSDDESPPQQQKKVKKSERKEKESDSKSKENNSTNEETKRKERKLKRIPQIAHPAWIAGQITIFLEHSYQHLPAIHTRSRVQHVGLCLSGQMVMLVGRIVKMYEKKGNHYCVLHAAMLDMRGRVLVLFEHTTIFNIASKAKL